MLNFVVSVGAFLPDGCTAFLPGGSHRVTGACLGAQSPSPPLSLSSLPEWRGGRLLRRSEGRKQFAIPEMGPTPHCPGEKLVA